MLGDADVSTAADATTRADSVTRRGERVVLGLPNFILVSGEVVIPKLKYKKSKKKYENRRRVCTVLEFTEALVHLSLFLPTIPTEALPEFKFVIDYIR